MQDMIVFSVGVGVAAIAIQILALISVYSRRDTLISFALTMLVVAAISALLWFGVFSPFASVAWSMYGLYFSVFCG